MTPEQQAEYRRVVEAAKRRGTLLVQAKEPPRNKVSAAEHARELNRQRQQRFRERHRGA